MALRCVTPSIRVNSLKIFRRISSEKYQLKIRNTGKPIPVVFALVKKEKKNQIEFSYSS